MKKIIERILQYFFNRKISKIMKPFLWELNSRETRDQIRFRLSKMIGTELNNIIEKQNVKILEMLSERGKGIFFPKLGILAQSSHAKGKNINATIGEAVEDDGSSMHLAEFDTLINIPE